MAGESASGDRSRWKRVLKWIGVVVGVVAILLVGVALLDWNALRGSVSRVASAKAGRPVQIHGDLDVRLFSPNPRVTINDLEVGNPRWAGPGPMAEVARISAEWEWLPLLKGQVVLPGVKIERPRLHLVRNAEGDANWQGPRSARSTSGVAPNLPVIRKFEVDDARITYHDFQRKLQFSGTASARESGSRNETQPFRMTGAGTINDRRFRLEMRGGPLVNVRRDRPYPFSLGMVAGPTQIVARGTINRPFDLGALAAKFSVSGDDLADLYPLTGLALPNTPPYNVSGHLERDGTRVTFDDVGGNVGDSDTQGDLMVELKGKRPFVKAQFTSRSLDLDDLATWFGAPPSVKEGEAASPAQRKIGQQMAEAGKLLPDAPLNVDRVRAMDAEVKYEAAAVKSGRFPLRSLSMNVNLRDGVLSVDPVSFTMPQGKLDGTVRLDAREDVAKTDVDVRIAGIALGQFRPKDSTQSPVEGDLKGRVKLQGTGNSMHRFASSSDGTATFVVPRGEIREAFAELTGINVARGLGLLLRNDQEKTNVRCGVADFKMEQGTLRAQNLVFDTDDVLITGRGDVSLENEAFDLSVHGEPKKLRLFRVRSPIAVTGPLRKPSVGLEAGKAIGQTGVAVALGVLVTPLAAVIAFVDPGLAEDANCSALLAEAKSDGAPVKTAEVNEADSDNR